MCMWHGAGSPIESNTGKRKVGNTNEDSMNLIVLTRPNLMT